MYPSSFEELSFHERVISFSPLLCNTRFVGAESAVEKFQIELQGLEPTIFFACTFQ